MPAKSESQILAYELHGNCYLNITSECTLRCQFCPKYNRTWEVQEYDLTLTREPSVSEVIEAIGDPKRYKQIVFCGLGEPTKRFDVLMEIARKMKAQGMSVRVNTDGLVNLVEGRDVTPEMAEVVDQLSISLNAQNEEIYRRHTRPRREGAFDAMLDFAKKAKAAGMDVSLSAIDGLEGVDIEACQKIADHLGVAFRRRVLDNVG
ncbi:MAG: TatD family nuclease-associated radical SAM protein [Gammaproteobacteria bacterium]|nr:TatD family nuclease-associated radical SAM protein [Gammaproteobacteria bacterium]